MKFSKNVLLIVEDEFNTVGGVQTYNKILIHIIESYFKNINIDIFLPNKSYKMFGKTEQKYSIYKYFYNDLIISNNSYINMLFYPIYARKKLKELFNIKKYDLIIDSTGIYFNNLSRLDNYFLIQHNSFDAYLSKEQKTFITSIKIIIKKIFGTRFPFNKTKNIILYDEKNKEQFQKLFKNNNVNINCISLCSTYISNINSARDLLARKDIIFFGRFANQKNIKELININNDLNKIDFYGSCDSTKYSQDVFKELVQKHWYKGILNSNSLYETINKYKFSINYSLYEGFSFSVVESLACGVPAIIKDSFTSASFLTSYDKRLLIPKDATIKEAIHQINSLLNLKDEEYYELCKKALIFFKQNLSYEIFEKKWLEIFNNFLK